MPLKFNPQKDTTVVDRVGQFMLNRIFVWNGHGSMYIALIFENNRTLGDG